MSTSKIITQSLPKGLKGLFVFSWEKTVYFAYLTPENEPGTFSLAKSEDGFGFNQVDTVSTISRDGQRLDISAAANFRVTSWQNGQPALTFQLTEGEETVTLLARMTYVSSWNVVDQLPTAGPTAIYQNTHGRQFMVSSSKAGLSLSSLKGKRWSKPQTLLSPREDHFDDQPLEVHHLSQMDNGYLLLYHSPTPFIVGAAVLDLADPEQINWRGSDAIWWQTPEWQGQEIAYLGSLVLSDQIFSYWQLEAGIYAVVYAYTRFPLELTTKNVSLRLTKPEVNPVISPRDENAWEAFNTFNPAAVYLDNKVHILYRAQGYDYVSTVGYASSSDGYQIDKRLNYPVYSPRAEFEYTKGKSPVGWAYMSGGGYGGIEDPRVTQIDDRLYMTYVAFDGWSPPRAAMTSISVEDFLNHRWFWEKPVLISPPGVIDKSAVIFPEKINGKYVIFHRIFPNILIDFVDSLNFDGTWWLEGQYKIEPRLDMWDSRKLGAGAPPLKTKAGWLLIYQGVDDRDDSRYKVGAMLLDLEDPRKVIARSNNPILEPDQEYENVGFKAGVVYPCGAVIIDQTLFVYYGAADSYVAVATANLDQFLSDLLHHEIVRLDPARIEKVM
jgi:predicted GH43/DUF377 family glycosyl hydrolase